MRIVLFGKSGQVGWELQRSLAPLGELIALSTEGTDHFGDLRDPERIAGTIRSLRPDVVVNAAAYTAVDRAESDVDMARTINALAPAAMAGACREAGALLVHYSTDYVFDGAGSQPWRESDATGPINVYGQTKLEGEQGVQAAGGRHLILRTSWVYAARGQNFAATMLRLGRERTELRVVNDQFGAPTGAELIADVTAHAIRATLDQPDLCGLYHLAAGGVTTWHGYASFVLEQARAAGVALQVRPDAVHAVASAEFPTPARRPGNSRLDCQRLQQAFGLRLPPWQHGVARMLQETIRP